MDLLSVLEQALLIIGAIFGLIIVMSFIFYKLKNMPSEEEKIVTVRESFTPPPSHTRENIVHSFALSKEEHLVYDNEEPNLQPILVRTPQPHKMSREDRFQVVNAQKMNNYSVQSGSNQNYKLTRNYLPY